MASKSIDDAAFEAMKRHRWPGNVRELENLVHRLGALYTEPSITVEIVESELREPISTTGQGDSDADQALGAVVEKFLARQFAELNGRLPLPGLYDRILREVELPLIEIALDATAGNQAKCADLLGINRNTLRKKITDLDIRVTRRRKLM